MDPEIRVMDVLWNYERLVNKLKVDIPVKNSSAILQHKIGALNL